MNLAVVLTTVLLIVPVELPDKTFIATLVLATRYPPLMVWLGVGAAFGIQTVIAVTAGGLLAQLPRTPVVVGAGLMFLAGAVVLWRSSSTADQEEAETEEEFEHKVYGPAVGLRAAAASFAVLFVAEWGDLSQLLTAGLVVRFDDPLAVFVGAWAALPLVSGLGAALGRALLKRLRLGTIQRVGAAVCLLMAVVTALELAGMSLPA
ncbi:MAG: TMEM165/GDT1 family protein [Actinomycetes bacterium]